MKQLNKLDYKIISKYCKIEKIHYQDIRRKNWKYFFIIPNENYNEIVDILKNKGYIGNFIYSCFDPEDYL